MLRARLRVLWVASFAIPAALQLSLAVWWSEAGIQGSPELLFGIVLVAASSCAVASGVIINRARHTNESELGYLGLFFLTMSVLPLIHGILTPGVIFNDPAPAAAAAFWSVPAAVTAAAPSFLMRSDLGIRIDQHWWRWVLNCILVVVAMGGLFIAAPSFIAAPVAGALPTIAIAVAVWLGWFVGVGVAGGSTVLDGLLGGTHVGYLRRVPGIDRRVGRLSAHRSRSTVHRPGSAR